jgi:hypothetical protein
MLNGYLCAAPNVIEQLAQGERKTRTEYKARVAATIETFDKVFNGRE